ncbi:hypothetical protein [Actinacidiphila glaucinigra]|uniref:Phage-related protein n=1 Tax=Actinacidiphila glaucinigra TaxID=235986 RepID=A0A239F104_9ACTN|nr:hypothetical protein [Actinacidiphila glaucinigra]SNS50515.1 Phage-related protein [Actinacidiphila glaucinigra]
MAEAQIVGRVAVKVMPDTSGFKQDLKEKLEKIENDLAITIRTKADPKGAQSDVLQIVREINRHNKDTDVRKIRFYTKLDYHGMATEVTNAVREYQNKANKHRVVFSATGRQVVQEARRTRQEANAELTDLHLAVNLDNQGSVLAAVGKVKAALVALGETDIEVDLNEDSLNAAAELFEDRLDEIGSIELRVDKSSQNSVKSAIAQIDRELEKLAEVEIRVKVDQASLEAERRKLEKALRLELKVDPRSSNSVKAAIAQIDAELAKRKEIDLSVKLDDKSLQKARERLEKHLTLDLTVDKKSMSSVEAALKQVEDQLDELSREEIKVKLDKRSLLVAQTQLKGILDAEVQAKVTADRAAAQQAADEIQAQLDEIRVRPDLDAKQVAQTKRQLEAAFAQMRNLRAKITPELDALAKRDVERDIDDLQDRIDKLKSDIEPEVSRTGIAAVLAHMAALTRDRIVDLIPRVKLSAAAAAVATLKALSGARVLGDLFRNLWDSIKNLDKAAPIIGSLATAILGLGGSGIAATSNLAALSASLASIAPTALLLPGLFGGIAVGLGVTIAAFKDFNKRVPEVKQALSGLQDAISDNFWAKAEKPIRAVVDDLLPKFTSGVKKTATELGGFFGQFATELGTSLGPVLDQMFTDLSASIGNATKGTDTFASIIARLGSVGTSYLPALANWFVDIAEKFDAFLKRKGENGLKEDIDQGIDALKDLGSVLFNVGGILAGVARAATAAGGSTLHTLADALQRIHAIVDSKGFQSGLTQVFYAAHQAMQEIATVSGPAVERFFKSLGGLLTSVLPQVGAIIGTALGAVADALAQPAVTDGIKALLDGVQSAVEALAPAMAPLGEALGSIASLAGTLLSSLGPLVAAVLTPLSQAFTQLVPVIEPLVTLLGDALGGVVAALAPLLLGLVSALTPLIEALVTGLAPIVPLISAALAVMSAALMPVIDVLIEILSAAILPLIPVVQRLAAEFLPKISEAFAHVAEALTPLLNILKQVVDFIMPILVPAIEWLAGILLDSLVEALDGVGKYFDATFDYVMAVWEFFSDLFHGNWDQLWGDILNIGKAFWNQIKAAFQILLNIGIIGAFGKGWKILKAGWEAGWTAIRTFGTSLWASIRTNFATFMTTLRETPTAALAALRKFFGDTWVSIRTAAVEAWEAVKRVFMSKVGETVTTVRELPGKVKAAFGDAKTLLLSAGRAIIRGLIDGLKSMFSSVRSTLGGLTDKLKDWKGPAPKDARLLYDAGQLIIKGLIKGLESQYDKVRQSLVDLTSKIPKNASKGLKDRISKDRTKLLQLAADWDAGAKKLEAARDKLDRIREDAKNFRDEIRDKVIDTGDVTKIEDDSFEGIKKGLTDAVEKAKRFAEVLKKLKALGLNATSFEQIASAGPEAGLKAAEEIANAGKDGVDSINDLQKELEKYATSAGNTASHYLFDAGIKAAEGLVKGLEKEQAAIEKQMLKIADAMVKAIKKALDIHSPSRLFRKLGQFVGKGFGLGVEDEQGRVERATNALASSATAGAASGQVTAAVSGGLSAGTGQSVTKVLNYYAGSNGGSLSSEEELFAAASRARMVGW